MDTIEWLETIGSDASLRYAQVDELKDVLEQAPAALRDAIAHDSRARLVAEFGSKAFYVTESSQTQHEDDEDDGDDKRDGALERQ